MTLGIGPLLDSPCTNQPTYFQNTLLGSRRAGTPWTCYSLIIDLHQRHSPFGYLSYGVGGQNLLFVKNYSYILGMNAHF